MNTADALTQNTTRFIRQFDQLGIADILVVGGKNASLGEMIRELGGHGILVPDGFATTADAYRYFLESTGLDKSIRELLSDLDASDLEQLKSRGRAVRDAILSTPLPGDLAESIVQAWHQLSQKSGVGEIAVAVRSSATAEDLPDASFAGQQETYLNVRGEGPLLDACRQCFASLFTDRAISYRVHQGFDHFDVALSIGVQAMVRSDLGSAGVIFTIDTETGFSDAILINAAWGLGENVVKGIVNPDQYCVFKPALAAGFQPIIQKTAGTKALRMVCSGDSSASTKNVPVPAEEREAFALDDADILQLARWAVQIEQHYSRKHGRPTPMDIEWARDGQTGDLYIVQARPETVQSQNAGQTIQQYRLGEHTSPVVSGCAVGQRIGSGTVRRIESPEQLTEFQDGEILVAEKTDPDWEPIMKKAAAIVTDHGGRTCHAAIVARELGLPAIVGTGDATAILENGRPITVSCAEGETGFVYDGLLPFEIEEIDLQAIPETRTRLMLNVANPGEVFSLASLPLDGVGLARMEFIISNHLKIHPLALLNYDNLEPRLQQEINAITTGYTDKVKFFVDRLAQGIGMIAAAFYPRDVIVRMSDFKSNEYANLTGGAAWEPTEENPMIGFRGASRYYDARYREGFGLECQAMKKVRDQMGLTNVKLMIPFCRTVQEGERVIAEMKQHGLVRGENGLEIYVMCEIPANVILADEFARIFDGFSIGSNDLTQLTLGIDRDSEIIAHIFDERNTAVTRLIAQAIQSVRRAGSKIGICGQAPSDFPEFTEFLVEQGIDSISVTPDVALKTKMIIATAEARLDQQQEEN